MTITSVTALQIGAQTVSIDWVSDVDAATEWRIFRNVDAAGDVRIGAANLLTARNFVDTDGPAVGSSVTYLIEDLAVDQATSPAIVIVAAEPAVAPVDYLASEIRYTSLAAVKERLGITTSAKDARITQAIIAGEVQLDVHLGRAFIPTEIPIAIREAATNIAQAVFKKGDSPTGTIAGTDDLFGSIDVAEIVRRELARNALLLGYQESFGIA